MLNTIIGKFKRNRQEEFVKESSIQTPIFIKPFDPKPKQLIDMETLCKTDIQKSIRTKIETDIRLMKYGMVGESNVNFELTYSKTPMLIFHDIRLEHKDKIANLDFLLITKGNIYILETKRLSGHIRVDSQGNFIRDIYGREEGMYSPITQSERQANVLFDILNETLHITRDMVVNLVVIANPKSIVNLDEAPDEIRNRILKFDQINNYLKENEYEIMDDALMGIIAGKVDSKIKYINYNLNDKYGIKDKPNKTIYNEKPKIETRKDKIKKELTQYRLMKSRELKIKAYHIFTNAEMERLLEELPTTEKHLALVNGFGYQKISKYGDDIIKVIKECKYE